MIQLNAQPDEVFGGFRALFGENRGGFLLGVCAGGGFLLHVVGDQVVYGFGLAFRLVHAGRDRAEHAVGEQRRAAHEVKLFNQNDARAGLGRVDGRRHAGRAGTDDHHVARGIFVLDDFAGNRGFEIVQIRARLLKAEGDGVQNAPAGHRRAAVSVHGHTLVGHDILRQFFQRGHADARRFGLADDVHLLDSAARNDGFHRDFAVVAPGRGLIRAVLNVRQCACAAEHQRRRHTGGKLLLHEKSSFDGNGMRGL